MMSRGMGGAVGGHRRVTVQGYGSRVGGSFCGMCVGVVLVGVSIFLLAWNEARVVRVAGGLDEAQSLVVDASIGSIDRRNEGKLVHVAGTLDPLPALTDAEFGVSATGLQLQRVVEMYQYEERTHSRTEKRGSSTVTIKDYSYHTVWKASKINSNTFDDPSYSNPTHWPISPSTESVRTAALGEWTLDGPVLKQIGTSHGVSLHDQEELYNLLGGTRDNRRLANGKSENGKAVRTRRGNVARSSQLPAEAAVRSDMLYLSGTYQPEIGDIRVYWKATTASQCSVVGVQRSGRFVPYITSGGDEVLLASGALKSSHQLFDSARSTNTAISWACRIGGTFLSLLGFNMILSPITVLPDIIPFIGNFISSLLGVGVCVVSTGLALTVSLVTIALAWIAQRPLLASALLVAAALPLLGVCSTRKKNQGGSGNRTNPDGPQARPEEPAPENGKKQS